MTTNQKGSEWPTPDDESTIDQLSTALDMSTSTLVRIIRDTNAWYADDLENLTYDLQSVISFIWNTPMDEKIQENLFFMFDKILDIAYSIQEALDIVMVGATFKIESILSEISQHMLRVIDEVETLSGSEHQIQFTDFNHAIVDLTSSLVGLTALITSFIRLIVMKDRNIPLTRVGSISSLLIIHHYALSSVACLLSRAVKFIGSLSKTSIPHLKETIAKYVLGLKNIVVGIYPVATMSELFNGLLQRKLAKQLLKSINGMIGEKMVNTIKTSTTSLLNVIQKYAPKEFHTLPDLIDQLIVILFQCGHTKLSRLEQFITYAFDGLFDVIHHISYDLDGNIKSSASTGSFQKPSGNIDISATYIRKYLKLLMRVAKSRNIAEKFYVNLVATIKGLISLIEDLLFPMNTIIDVRQSDDDYSITLVSSLQFIALYAIGLITTPLQAYTKNIQNISDHDNIYVNVSAILSLSLINIQLTLDYSNEQSSFETIKKLLGNFEDLFQDLSDLDIEKYVISSKSVNATRIHLLNKVHYIRV